LSLDALVDVTDARKISYGLRDSQLTGSWWKGVMRAVNRHVVLP
jgi:hypothetical protein